MKPKVKLYFKYPSIRSIKLLNPQKRIEYISEKLRANLDAVTKKIGSDQFQVIGSKRKPRGIEIQSDKKTLAAIQKLKCFDSRLTSDNKGSLNTFEPYFCFKVIFAIQIEGRKSGMQTVEERFVLVKARTWKAAEARVIRQFKKNDEPYLNAYGQLVRWKFESIEESYHTFIENAHDFDSPTEVFSKLKKRRMKDMNVWDGKI